jgi:hypothetical protein
MTNEATKILLMFLIMGSLQAAIHISKIRVSQQWAFLCRAMAHVWSSVTLTDRTLRAAFHTTQVPWASAGLLKRRLS